MQNREYFLFTLTFQKVLLKPLYNNAQIEGLTRCAIYLPVCKILESVMGLNMITSLSFPSIYNDYISGYFWLPLSVNNQLNLQFSFTAFLAHLVKGLLLLQYK